mgnify:CR=1 FL=1|jgi:hypothetical protein
MLLWICLRWPDASTPLTDRHDLLQRLALSMLQYTPKVAFFRQDSVVLEVATSLSLFGGIRRLVQAVRRQAIEPPHRMRVGMAPSASGAWLLAGAAAGARRVVRLSSLERCLSRLPVSALPETGLHWQWIENIGCECLGDLSRLPRAGLQQRSSPALVHALDLAYGRQPESLAWFQSPDVFCQKRQLDFNLQQADAIQSAAQPLLHALCGWLHARQEALHEFSLILHHEKGRHACPPTVVSLRFSDATWRLEDFNRLLAERLNHSTVQRQVIALELSAGPAHARAPANDTLFPDPARFAQDEHRLLDLLSARLGNVGILRPAPRAHHLPECANVWESGTQAPASSSFPASVGDKPRPFWLLPQPQALSTRHERPLHQGRPLRLIQGPERIETGWWTPGGHQRRDYFVAEDPDGARYWVYRQREVGDGWFLHGFFA